MNDLLMVYTSEGRWVARVANAGIEYAFRYLAEEPDFSGLCVRSLALAMRVSREQVIQSIAGNGIFDLPDGIPAERVVGELFDATQVLRVGGGPVFTTEAALAQDLDGAGEALLVALG
ncbi:MAG: hypothetical protein V4645_14195 [Pseudomonadota bacterium]